MYRVKITHITTISDKIYDVQLSKGNIICAIHLEITTIVLRFRYNKRFTIVYGSNEETSKHDV